jgi:hypothetical protein
MSEDYRRPLGYESYRVYRDSSVWSETSQKFLKPIKASSGYIHVTLTNEYGPKAMSLHSLVATVWLGERPAGMVVNHIDNNRANNKVENLEWVTQSRNVKHAYEIGARVIDERHRQRARELGAKRRKTSTELDREVIEAYSPKRGIKTQLSRNFNISRDIVKRILKENGIE